MAERSTIARPYADAAFARRATRTTSPVWARSSRSRRRSPPTRRWPRRSASPKLDAAAKTSLFLSIGGERFSARVRNFVRILIEGDRIEVLPEIRALYEARKNEADGVAKATIETALPLSDSAARPS